MTSPRRRLAALVLAPLLIAGLAACAGAEPEAQLTPAVTPTASEIVAEPAAPGSRVPAACDDIVASERVTGVVEVLTAGYVELSASIDQAGFLECIVRDGLLGSAAVVLSVGVALDQPEGALKEIVTQASSNGRPTGFAGDASVSECVTGVASYCTAQVQVGGYIAELVLNYDGDLTPGMQDDTLAYLTELADRMAQWPAPTAAWVAPEGALRWDRDCVGGLGSNEALVRDAIPFEVQSVVAYGRGDGSMFGERAMVAASFAECVWRGPGGEVTVSILPGGSRLLDEGIGLSGEPTTIAGARAATLVNDNPGVVLAADIRDSWVWVRVEPGFGSDPSSAEQVARDVLEVVVSNF